MKKRFLLITFTLLLTNYLFAQIEESKLNKIDSIFLDWNTPNHPGGAVEIAYKGKPIFNSAYGLASLEYLVPNTTGTRFNIASVSKQFSAMGIVLLHLEGKLSVDDDIRKYMPELPDFGETITIRHMLHHTSGLRSLHAMLGLAGWRGDDSRTNEDLDRFMLKQKELNFKPGEEYLYCNTGFMFLANIIEKVTGENFVDWMQKSVFTPLGMLDTYVEDEYNRIVPNNATSYDGSKKAGFKREVEYWGYIGSGNMHSTTSDLTKWMNNFITPQEGWADAFKMMQTVDNFNNGKPNKYAFGVNVDAYKGVKMIQHGGSIGGFRSIAVAFPDKEISIIILTNFSTSGTSNLAQKVSDILFDLPKNYEPIVQVKGIDVASDELAKYEGSYWNDKDNYVQKIFVENDTLKYAKSNRSGQAIIPIAKVQFQLVGSTSKITYTFDTKQRTLTVKVDDEEPVTSAKFDTAEPTVKELQSYAGEFYSPELETSYWISVVDNKLQIHHPRHGDSEVEYIKKDVLNAKYPISIIKYKKDKRGKVTGVYISNGRARNVWFEKRS